MVKALQPYIILAVSMVTGLLATMSIHAQGNLTPPGAPTPSMKTLEQVEPRIDLATVAGDATYRHVISQSGSYYLSGNLVVTVLSAGGIYIAAPNVTLDLNGFKISHISGSGGYGIRVHGGSKLITIRNGTVSGFDYGIYNWTPSSLLQELGISGCSSNGIYSGTASRIVNCSAHDNSGTGIYANDGSSLEGCTAYNNQGTYGIYAGIGSSLRSCIAYYNQSDFGIYAGYGSSLEGCTANHNQSTYSIFAGDKSSLIGCTANNNYSDASSSYGFHVGNGSTLRGCAANYNQSTYGIHSGYGSSLTGCTANENYSDASASYGIYVGHGASLIGCTANFNKNLDIASQSTSEKGVGICAIDKGITIKDCTILANMGDGIRIGSDSLVTGNNCSKNGEGGDGAGIHALFSSNRIDSNNVTNNDRGIDVDTAGNIIVRNSASGNTTDYDITATNTVGTIQTSPVGAGAWDNFSF